jgi:hypothetical protein
MTLRQYLDRDRYRDFGFVLMVCCIVGMCASAYLLKAHPLAQALGLGCSMLLPISGLNLRRLIRCPRCSARLGQLAWIYALSRPGKRGRRHPTAVIKLEQLGGCPHCGLRLDQEIGTKEPRPA